MTFIMPLRIDMPLLSPTMTKGNLVSWVKKEGDSICAGDVIFEIDTDKATMEVEANYDGILAKILIQEGTRDIPVKTAIAVVRISGDTDEDIRRIIEELLADNDQAVTQTTVPTKQAEVNEPLSQSRKILAEKLTKAKQEIPHFYLSATANVSALLELRKELNNSGKISTKITVNDFIIKAVAMALSKFTAINSMWENNSIKRLDSIDIAIAVDINDGLVTPIITSADKKSLVEISKEIKELVKLAKNHMLRPQQILGGSITVSNLGMYGIDNFYSIINSPQASIISVGKAKKLPLCSIQGNIECADMINIGYSVDHRVIDGAVAAQFLDMLVERLQTPVDLVD
jgi:pyruvate/2-oxoglutarate dehydrogenase complex dihydrolipoamide acyltransferase (E2) component